MKLELSPEQAEEIKRRILDFDDWEWCDCQECRRDPHSHAVRTETSLQQLAEFVVLDDEQD